MKYLLDTNVVSEMRKPRRAHPEVAAWFARVQDTELFLSVMTVTEIEIGQLRLALKDPGQANIFRSWLHEELIPAYRQRILITDLDVSLRLATLHVHRTRTERDAILAATALVHDLIVVTRNVKDFMGTGVKLLNPFGADPKVMTV